MKKLHLTLYLFIFSPYIFAQWQKMADVPVDLAFPVVVELNGNIHVIGGGGPSGASNLHLRYQPFLNKWDTLAPLPFLAQQPAGAVVNGKIHFCGGGYPNSGSRLDKHYYYDADSAKWFLADKMPVATAIHKAVSFDNKLFVMSGQPDKTLCETYDPSSKIWTQKNPLPDQNFWYSALASTSNSIYRFGGGGFGAPTGAAHSYDKVNDTWNTIPGLPVPLHAASAAALNDSLIFISGGYYSGLTYDITYIYHTRKKLYYPSNSMPFGTNYHSMVLAQGCVYSVGGDNSSVSGAGTSMIKICSPEYKWAVSTGKQLLEKPYSVIRTNDKLILNFKPDSKPAYIEILDLSGKRLNGIHPEAGGLALELNTSEFAKGTYLVKICMGQQEYFEKYLVF